jgi:ribosomally synthesized peptide (two-chain TOMM family)
MSTPLFQARAATGTDYKPGALESTMHWQVIWPRAIARAWEDKAFHDALVADPRKAISDHFGYELSEDLDLTVVDAPAEATFDATAEQKPEGTTDPWAKLPKLKLTISIPPAPEPALQAVAITSYQDTGRTYPFTCC